MRLENWVVEGNPYAAPEMHLCLLNGEVYGHPSERFPDGKRIAISRVVAVQGESVVTRSGSVYDLGEPDPDYEKAFPGAKARALEVLRNACKEAEA